MSERTFRARSWADLVSQVSGWLRDLSQLGPDAFAAGPRPVKVTMQVTEPASPKSLVTWAVLVDATDTGLRVQAATRDEALKLAQMQAKPQIDETVNVLQTKGRHTKGKDGGKA